MDVELSNALDLDASDNPLSRLRLDWGAALERAEYNPEVNISIGPIDRDYDPENEDPRAVHNHVASIREKVGVHYHPEVDEHYKIVRGTGVIHLGLVEDDQVTLKGSKVVREGQCFTIPAGYAHQLVNMGQDDLVIEFQCPNDHLNDTNRVILSENAFDVS